MSISDEIIEALNQAREQEEQKPAVKKVKEKPKPEVKPEEKVEIVGFPIYHALKWDDLGLGGIRYMGFLPTRAVRIEAKKDKWTITGARANMPVLISIAAGAGGLLIFLQDLLRMVEMEWGTFSRIGTIFLVLLPTLINLLTRTSKIELYPFEVEFLGYDPKSQILLLSTLSQPGGLVALRIDMPSNEKVRKFEEEKLMEKLNHIHRGFMNIEGQTIADTSKLQNWSLWTLVWLLVFWFYFKFGINF
ncbi:MAG TPA: hypothetical protein ENN67_08345 [Firmicutes bacterium]|nr:hypothetical protein [Bacillota bacterium]